MAWRILVTKFQRKLSKLLLVCITFNGCNTVQTVRVWQLQRPVPTNAVFLRCLVHQFTYSTHFRVGTQQARQVDSVENVQEPRGFSSQESKNKLAKQILKKS